MSGNEVARAMSCLIPGSPDSDPQCHHPQPDGRQPRRQGHASVHRQPVLSGIGLCPADRLGMASLQHHATRHAGAPAPSQSGRASHSPIYGPVLCG